MISDHVDENIMALKKALGNDSSLIVRKFKTALPNETDCAVVSFDGMVDSEYISENVIKKIMAYSLPHRRNSTDDIAAHAMDANEIKQSTSKDEIILSLMSGDCILFCEHDSRCMIISSKGYLKRSVDEPANEKNAKGPHEGFVEPLVHNIALIRRRLKSDMLRMEYVHFSATSKTSGCICYIEGVADMRIVDELKQRLKTIENTDIVDINYIIENIKDSPLSPFKTAGTSERPDVIAAKLLEGRVALVIDGCPLVMTVPFIFIEYFQSGDDYYVNYLFSSFNRLLRILCFYLAVSVPAIYIALLTFHQEVLPTKLLISIAMARSGVPFPIVLETFLLLIAFEIMRDASIRMSPSLGQSLSIVGALILGQASVAAKIISAPLVIITAITGIAGLINTQLKDVSVLYRFVLMFISYALGLPGVIIGLMLMTLQISCTKSFGVYYSAYLVPDKPKYAKDAFIRAPFSFKSYFPVFKGIIGNVQRKDDSDEADS